MNGTAPGTRPDAHHRCCDHGAEDLLLAPCCHRGRTLIRHPDIERDQAAAVGREVTIDSEAGTVVWPGGADLAPDTLYGRLRTGAWPDEDVAA
jgi:hypothetical protein